jgi:hypothetical protein
MMFLDPGFAIFNDYERPADTPIVSGNVHSTLMVVDINTHEFGDPAHSSQPSESIQKELWAPG